MSAKQEHLRPHPAAVPPTKNLQIKKLFASRTDKYTYAFNSRSYVDFDVYNVSKRPTIDRSGVCKLIATSAKPVVFFMCYDVGDDPVLQAFIRHIVCCVAFPGERTKILFFDMRDLYDISPKHQELIETEISRKCGRPVDLINASCLSGKCLYLQSFKSRTEVGWCIAWALYFLNVLTKPLFRGKYIADMTEAQYSLHVKNLYTTIYRHLSTEKSNKLIERWYVQIFSSF